MVTENLKSVEERIQAACDRAGRDRRDVKLVCVTKTKPLPLLQEAYADGQRDFGENKVQEILAKKPQLPPDIRWHMIGHLQTNKVRQIIGQTVMIHSVDWQRRSAGGLLPQVLSCRFSSKSTPQRSLQNSA